MEDEKVEVVAELTAKGFKKAERSLERKHDETLMWGSLPCTGGTRLTYINEKLSSKTRNKIQAHREIYHKLWDNFQSLRNGTSIITDC